MESFDNVTSLEEMYSLDSGQEKEIKVEEETENIQDITDDALETMLMEDQSQNATGNPQIQTAVCQSATQQQSVYKVPDSKVVLATQPLQVFTQQPVGNPVVTRFVMKKNPAGNSPATIVSQQQPQPQQPQSFGNFVVNSNVSGVQTLTVQGNNFTFASPGKGNFKIPISPAKNSIKVSMVSPSSGIVSNSVKTINLNSSLGATASPQLQSKFQFQTLMPNHPANVGTNSQQRIQTTVNPQQQVFKIVPAGNERTHQGLTNILPAQSGSQFAIAAVNNQPKLQQFVNVQPVQRIVQQPQAKTQRLIMPATNVMPQPQTSIVNLSPGTILQAGNVGYAMVSAKYVEQLKKQFSNQIYNNDSNKVATSEQPTQSFPKSSVQVNGKVRKPCNCTKSMCLKLYCECFTNGHFCDGCNCINCHNNLEFDAERSKAIKQCLDRNPLAFKPKIGRGGDSSRTHQKGCNCKRSGCLKNYCECYEARIPCTSKCKCIGCKNLEEDGSSQGEPLSLMHLADAAAVRCQQQAAARVKISSHIGEIRSSHHRPHTAPSGERLPSTFFTQEVIEATCTCLLAQAEEAEKTNRSLPVAEMMILEEFGRCMMQIIQAAGKAKSNS